jgi:formate dehydrogenase subunit gamma
VVAAMATIGAFIIHVYMSTAMVSGSVSAMVHGGVTASWAKTHHRLWYEQITRGSAEKRS